MRHFFVDDITFSQFIFEQFKIEYDKIIDRFTRIIRYNFSKSIAQEDTSLRSLSFRSETELTVNSTKTFSLIPSNSDRFRRARVSC